MSLNQYNIVVKLSATGSLDLVAGKRLVGQFGRWGARYQRTDPCRADRGWIIPKTLYVVWRFDNPRDLERIIMTIAGTSEYGYSGDGGLGCSARNRFRGGDYLGLFGRYLFL